MMDAEDPKAVSISHCFNPSRKLKSNPGTMAKQTVVTSNTPAAKQFVTANGCVRVPILAIDVYEHFPR